MIEHLGTLFTVGRIGGAIKNWLALKEEVKVVDDGWLRKSWIQDRMAKSGTVIRWTNPEKIELRKSSGWQVIYEIDRKRRVRKVLQNASGQILIGRHNNLS